MPQDDSFSNKNHSCLYRAFAVCVLCLAIFQFSENTADPDLWGHVFFGRQFVQTGVLMKTDLYSWTANGHASFDHEYLGEVPFALAHLWLGGTGLLLLKILVGLVTFGIALSIATRRANEFTRAVAWAFGALAVVEISFGFAARPQIFTALALALELWVLRQIHQGKLRWAIALPPLFALWINLHGGALAGIILFFVSAAATSSQFLLKNFAPAKTDLWLNLETPPRAIAILWISAVAITASLLLNPFGFELVRWLVGSVLWLRPEIEEWNPATLNWDHAPFFFCAILAALAFFLSRRPRVLWEMAVTALLFAMAFRSVRHTPLFCITALAFVPPHLADALERFRVHVRRFEKLFQSPRVQKIFAAVFAVAAAGILAATLTLHKERFWTMEVPRAQYPVAAIQFIQRHELRGNLLSFFDWGEECIWELPDSRVSMDGRLDSCYPPEIIAAHWKFYNAEPFDTHALNLDRADFALLPLHLAGALALAKNDGWQPAYFDHLAVVLVKNPTQFPKLSGLELPVQGGSNATQGRAAFPNQSPAR
jgi:hypothetical protein